jgi:hypothetical protein
MKKTVLAVALLLPFVSAMHAESADTNNDSNKPKGSPTIKGLYLGMKATDAIEEIKKINNTPELAFQVGAPYGGFGNYICCQMTAREIEFDAKANGGIVRVNGKIVPINRVNGGVVPKEGYPLVKVDPFTEIDNNNYVKKITFSGSKTSELFGTRALNAEEFAKKVLGSYNIPDLKPNETGDGWTYVSENGWSIKIDQNHQIELSKEDVVKKMD